MFRRDFFKMLGAAAASVVCAPLAKLLPERSKNKFPPRLTMGQILKIRMPVRFFVKEDLGLSEKDFVEHYIRPRFELALDAEEKDRALAFDDLVAIMRKTDADMKALTGVTSLNG